MTVRAFLQTVAERLLFGPCLRPESSDHSLDYWSSAALLLINTTQLVANAAGNAGGAIFLRGEHAYAEIADSSFEFNASPAGALIVISCVLCLVMLFKVGLQAVLCTRRARSICTTEIGSTTTRPAPPASASDTMVGCLGFPDSSTRAFPC